MKNNKRMLKYVNCIIYIILIGIIISLLVDKNIIIGKEKQVIKEMTQSELETQLNSNIEQLNSEHTDYMNYIQTCKTQIATVLTNKGVETSDQETLEIMAANIEKVCDNYYNLGIADGTAQANFKKLYSYSKVAAGTDLTTSYIAGQKCMVVIGGGSLYSEGGLKRATTATNSGVHILEAGESISSKSGSTTKSYAFSYLFMYAIGLE